MKTFIAKYDWHGRYGACEERTYVIVAETKEVALGLVLTEDARTKETEWSIEEVDTSKNSATLLCSEIL